MGVERAGTAKLLDVLEHVVEGGIVTGGAKLESSSALDQDPSKQKIAPPAGLPPRGEGEPGETA
jgi:hypothetical protein